MITTSPFYSVAFDGYDTANTDAEKWVIIQVVINRAIAACDWTQFQDANLIPAKVVAFQEYRDTLRGLKTVVGNPDDITLPSPLTIEASDYLSSDGALQRRQSYTDLINIPNWATWTQAQAETWKNTNIGTPLATARTDLAALATLNLTTFKVVIGRLLDILDAMLVMLWALARMAIVLRNKNWPPANGQALK